jgi:hypothetical protein
MRPAGSEEISKRLVIDDVDGAIVLGNPSNDVGACLHICVWMKRGVSQGLTLTSEC